MGISELYKELASAIVSSTDKAEKYSVLLDMRDFSAEQIPLAKEEAKELPPPSKLSDLSSYYVIDDLNNKYEVDEAGNLTKI